MRDVLDARGAGRVSYRAFRALVRRYDELAVEVTPYNTTPCGAMQCAVVRRACRGGARGTCAMEIERDDTLAVEARAALCTIGIDCGVVFSL